MLSPSTTTPFERNLRLMVKRGKKMEKLRSVMKLLESEVPLPIKNYDHALSGEFAGRRECHVEPDWLLVYRIFGDEIRFERTGTHSDIYG